MAHNFVKPTSLWTTPSASEIRARTELYFGSERPPGEVTEAEFTDFMDRKITPRFPGRPRPVPELNWSPHQGTVDYGRLSSSLHSQEAWRTCSDEG